MAINSIINAVAEYPDCNKSEQKIQSGAQAVYLLPSTGAMESSNIQISNENEDIMDENQQIKSTNSKRIKSIVDDTNNKIKNVRRRCEFFYHEDINKVSIKVLDAVTNEVIKEIPPEETMDMIRKLWEIVGLLVDEKG